MENVNFISRSLLKSFASPLYQATLELLKSGNECTYLLIVHYTYKPDGSSSHYRVTTYNSYNTAFDDFFSIVRSNF